jgi:ABC-2 type transport system permease protein
MNLNVLSAVFKRNFVSYFANPIGYVFLCVFVLLSSFAAFWPNEFFNNNLANLDQLNHWFPLIMLIFIPAVTMSIWAQERQQGTDELLLTIPGSDFEVVLGKYLAALAIFTVSLLFSLVCNFANLASLGEPDGGLFLGTYAGYWLIGMAMLGIGMVASFLTKNLTISFIMAALLCAPLVLLAYSDALLPTDLAIAVKHWSIGQQLHDFGRGVISLSGLVYFGMILAVSLYVSTILLGRRHWGPESLHLPVWIVYPLVVLTWAVIIAVIYGVLLLLYGATVIFIGYMTSAPLPQAVPDEGVLSIGTAYKIVVFFLVSAAWIVIGLFVIFFAFRQGWKWFPDRVPWMVFHFVSRVAALLVIAVGVNVLFERYDSHADVTSERVNSLSRPAKQLLTGIKFSRPVHVEAFISPEVPEAYVQTRLNLLAALRELQGYGSGQIEVRVNDTNRFSEEAKTAERLYDIRPKQVVATTQGVKSMEPIFMGVALTCGLQKVRLPFIDRGTPLEYELVRSLCTLAQTTGTDEPADSGGGSSQETKRKVVGIVPTDAPLYNPSRWPLINELEKQYEVKQVDMNKPIGRKDYDVLLAVQPSTLPPEQMDAFVEAVGNGVPTAIFEDPFPILSELSPTSQPRRPPQGMEMFMRGPMPKGDLEKLWNLLRVTFPPDQIVWQEYNPYPKISELTRQKEYVFLDAASGAEFNPKDPVSAGMQQLLFLFAGQIKGDHDTPFKFTPLLKTGRINNGIMRYRDLVKEKFTIFGTTMTLDEQRKYIPANHDYTMAARIKGEEQKGDDPKNRISVNVVVVTDVDAISPGIFAVREQGDNPEQGINFDFDNVTFLLNCLDSLAGDDRFIEIRSHRPKHRTLASIEAATAGYKTEAAKEREKYTKECDEGLKEEREKMAKKIEEIRKRKDASLEDVMNELSIAEEEGNRRLEDKEAQARLNKDQQIEQSDSKLAQEIDRVRRQYKIRAVVIPPIPPLVIAVIVFFTRRSREREGVSRSRMK